MAHKGPHPIRFAILILPYGAAFGVVANALSVLAVQNGVPEEAFGKVIASTYAVHSFKFLWAPIVDTTLTRRTWYLISSVLTCFGVLAFMAMPLTAADLGALTVVILVAQIGLTLMGMACESFLGLSVPDGEKGTASGWYNAAQFVAQGLGGWFMLKLTDWLPERWMAGAVFAGVMLPCALPLIGLVVPRSEGPPVRLGVALAQLGRDLLALVRSRFGATGLVISLLPVGAAAASNLFPEAAGRWGIGQSYRTEIAGVAMGSHDVIGLFTGFIAAALSGAGALVGGRLSDRMPRRLAYAGAGIALALSAILMAIAPREPWAWIALGSLYNFFTGLAFAAFTSFVLETIGGGAVATKYNIFAGLANLAISYVTFFDSVALGRGGAVWGTTAMLLTDAGLTVAGCVVLVAMYAYIKSRGA